MSRTTPLWLLALAACTGPTDDPVDPTDGAETDAVETDPAETDATQASQTFSVTETSPSASPPDCDDSTLQAVVDTLTSWPQTRACAFASAGLATQAQDVALTMHLDVDDSDALAVGETFRVTWDPTAGIAADETTGWLKLQEGTGLIDAFCNDVAYPSTVSRTWTPIDGWMALEVTAADGSWEPWGAPFTGTIELRSVVVEADDAQGTTCTLPDVDLEGLHLGWLPG